MPRKTKSLTASIIKRIWNREKTITVLFLVSFVSILIKGCGNSCGLQLNTLTSAQDVILSLAVSFLSGIVVYFLTIILPEERKRRSLLVEIEQVFLQLETSFIEMAVELQIGDYENPDEYAQNAVNNVKRWCNCMSESDDYSLSKFRLQFESLKESFTRLTEYLVGFSSVLSEDEIAKIIEIRQRNVSKRIIYLDGVKNLLNLEEIREYFKDIAILYKDVCNLHEMIINSIYRKKDNEAT